MIAMDYLFLLRQMWAGMIGKMFDFLYCSLKYFQYRSHHSLSLMEVRERERSWMYAIVKDLREMFNPPELDDLNPNFVTLDAGIRVKNFKCR